MLARAVARIHASKMPPSTNGGPADSVVERRNVLIDSAIPDVASVMEGCPASPGYLHNLHRSESLRASGCEIRLRLQGRLHGAREAYADSAARSHDVELYVKQAHNSPLTMRLRDHLLGLYERLTPMSAYPPALQVFRAGDDAPFRELDDVGEFSAEFLLVVSELIFIQEKTNYPTGSMTQKLYKAFGEKDRFGVIAMATQTKFGAG